jgi:hypothetical protein
MNSLGLACLTQIKVTAFSAFVANTNERKLATTVTPDTIVHSWDGIVLKQIAHSLSNFKIDGYWVRYKKFRQKAQKLRFSEFRQRALDLKQRCKRWMSKEALKIRITQLKLSAMRALVMFSWQQQFHANLRCRPRRKDWEFDFRIVSRRPHSVWATFDLDINQLAIGGPSRIPIIFQFPSFEHPSSAWDRGTIGKIHISQQFHRGDILGSAW